MNKEEFYDLISHYSVHILVGFILIFQVIILVKLTYLEESSQEIGRQLSDTQSILGVSVAPDTGKITPTKLVVKSTEKTQVLLPIKPDNNKDIAYIEKGFKETDNYYPTDTPLVYYISDTIKDAGTQYSKKLVNSGWQIINIKKSSKPGTDYIESFTADNGSSLFEVEFLQKFPSYPKQVTDGSFIKILLKK